MPGINKKLRTGRVLGRTAFKLQIYGREQGFSAFYARKMVYGDERVAFILPRVQSNYCFCTAQRTRVYITHLKDSSGEAFWNRCLHELSDIFVRLRMPQYIGLEG